MVAKGFLLVARMLLLGEATAYAEALTEPDPYGVQEEEILVAESLENESMVPEIEDITDDDEWLFEEEEADDYGIGKLVE